MNKSILFTKTFKDEQMLNDKKELDEKLIEMPFLLLPIKFFNSHQGYNKKFRIRTIIICFVIFIFFSNFLLQMVLDYKEKHNKDKDYIFLKIGCYSYYIQKVKKTKKS